MYSVNDWRNYIAHAYDWSTGKNPPDYNHDYYEKNKERILANRKAKNGGVRDFGGAGVGYKAKTDDGKSYENDDDWSDELTPEEIANIKAHNDQIEKNISELTKTVNDYIAANRGKLSNDQIAKLKKDLATQTEIAREQMISTKNSDDYNYVMGLRKKSGSSSKSSGGSSKRSSSSTSRKTSGSSSSGKNNPKNYTEGAKRRQTNTNSAKKTSEERRGSEGSLEDLRKRAQRDILKGRR